MSSKIAKKLTVRLKARPKPESLPSIQDFNAVGDALLQGAFLASLSEGQLVLVLSEICKCLKARWPHFDIDAFKNHVAMQLIRNSQKYKDC